MNRHLNPAAIRHSLSDERDYLSAFVIAVALLVSAFVLVGGARDDLISLILWRPLSALLLVFAVVFHGAEAWRRGKGLIIFALAIVLLVAAHLIPLPPAIWSALPGRELVTDVYRAAGLELPWQPISLAQARTWNALFSLTGPLAMLIVALVLPEHRHRQLLYIVLALGFLSGIIGMIQAIGPAYGPLYFYRITNHGTSVGLFANRNHQAAMLATLLPLLAASISLFRGKPDKLFFQRALTLACGALLIPLILMTGSRAGIVLGIVGAASAYWWVYRTPQSTGRVVGIRADHRSRLVGLAIAVMLMVVIAIIAFRTPALTRLLESDPTSDLRIKALPVVLEGIWTYFPFGSGIGTFVETYQIAEPDALISPRYFNHAHNDFVEVALTGGLLGIGFMVLIAASWIIAFVALARLKVSRDDFRFAPAVLGRAGLASLAILALASATDYPLRVPSVIIFAALMAVWALNSLKVSRKLPE